MYFVTTIWRGAINVNNMRTFTEEAKAWEYYNSLIDYPTYKRLYQTFEDSPPLLLRKPTEPQKEPL